MGESVVEDDQCESGDQVQESEVTTATDTRSEFYAAYKRQAEIFDKELKGYNKELNVTLLFAALFAVIASTFLRLEENNHLLLVWDNQQAASTVTTIVFCSLAASLFVAVLALFAKRALTHYAILDFTAADPSHGRYRAPSSVHRFVPRIFGLFIEGLSFVLQAALLIVAYVLANHLWSQDHRTASLTVAGAEILCIALITSATIGPALLGVSDGTITKSIRKPLLQALASKKPNVKKFRQRTLPKRRPSALVSDEGNLEKVAIVSDKDVPLSVIFDKQSIDWDDCVSDSLCITWMFDRPIDSDEGTVILDFIADVVWHSGICEVPFANVFEIFDRCFDYSKGHATLIPRLRDRAYMAGRALVHLGIQRKCIGEEDGDPLKGLRGTRGSYSSCSYDSDLDSILNLVDRLFGTPQPIDWSGFGFSGSHQRWLSHILLYRAWDHLCYASKLPDDVEAFVANAFSSEDTHPAVVADCLFIISLVIGIPLHVEDLAVDDKSSKSEELYKWISSKLEGTFKDHVVQEYARSLDGIRLLIPLQNSTVATNCYNLLLVILSSSLEKEEIWAAARLAMHGAYKWDTFLPWVDDPDQFAKFLAYHFAIQAKGQDDVARDPIEEVLRAIAYASCERTVEGLKKYDSTDKLFVDGIRKAFEEDRPFETRKAALFFMRGIQDRWFDDSSEDFMSDEEKDEFCKNWASAVDGIDHTTDVQKAACETLFGMMNSEKWRSHVVKEKLKLMEYFASIPDDFKHFAACKGNASVLAWLRSIADEAQEDSRETKFWKLWLGILWSDYVNLPEDVKDQVLEVTKVVISKSRHDVSYISRIMVAEKERCQAELGAYQAVSLDDEAVRWRVKVEGLNESIEKFEEVVGKKAV